MPISDHRPVNHLRRLSPEWYRGEAAVHWTMGIDGRRTGWLTDGHHLRLRELLLHTLHRYDLICPVYCFMPDHGHFVRMGIRREGGSDQLGAAKFFRRAWNGLLRESRHRLQKQAHDHVLREEERQQDAFANACGYIVENPLRAGLEEEGGEDRWPYVGALVPGIPELDFRWEDYRDRFWKIRLKVMEE